MIRQTSALMLAAALLGAPAVGFVAPPAFAAPTAPAMNPGSIVYDMDGKEIGTVVDVLMNTHNQAYAVLDVKPYLGKEKLVLVPADHIAGTADHMTMNATKTMVMRMGAIEYNMPSGGH